VKIPVSTAVRLAGDGIIRGIKDSSGDMDEFRRLRQQLGDLDGFSLLTGSDSSADMALFEQADGMIAGMANIDPHGFAQMYQTALGDDWAAVRAQQDRLFALRDLALVGVPRVSSFSATIGGFKAALVHRGVIECDALQLPLCELDDRERRLVAELVDRAGLGRVGPA
jgi:4-hydroxy-tetrahydrodipicolinate synthase